MVLECEWITLLFLPKQFLKQCIIGNGMLPYVSFAFLFIVLTAAVTQASLQSMLHKILTAGPSAFNITTLLSQASQLSSQGINQFVLTHASISTCLKNTTGPF